MASRLRSPIPSPSKVAAVGRSIFGPAPVPGKSQRLWSGKRRDSGARRSRSWDGIRVSRTPGAARSPSLPGELLCCEMSGKPSVDVDRGNVKPRCNECGGVAAVVHVDLRGPARAMVRCCQRMRHTVRERTPGSDPVAQSLYQLMNIHAPNGHMPGARTFIGIDARGGYHRILNRLTTIRLEPIATSSLRCTSRGKANNRTAVFH